MMKDSDIRYIGVDDRQIDLFEGQYPVPAGMAYNSYLILDEQIAVLDTVDARYGGEWGEKLAAALADRQPDYLIVQHMEPDHSAQIKLFMARYGQARLVATAKAFAMMKNYFGTDFPQRQIVVKEGDSLQLGRHTLTFYTAPMVHWPEVMVTYDSEAKTLFSADAFGKFGALDNQQEWADEARRYYFGIVGKYGAQVQALLKKAAALDIQTIAPLHGPGLQGSALSQALSLYQTWAAYGVESPGVVVAYTSVYGHTQAAVAYLAEALRAQGCPQVSVFDLARCDIFAAVAAAFRYGKLVLATTTYNGDIFPFMRTYLEHLRERNFRQRQIALIENGSWAPQAAKVMGNMLEGGQELTFVAPTVRILSALNEENQAQLQALAQELCRDF